MLPACTTRSHFNVQYVVCADIAALVRNDAQQLATDVHVALGLEDRPVPPRPILPPPGATSDVAYPARWFPSILSNFSLYTASTKVTAAP